MILLHTTSFRFPNANCPDMVFTQKVHCKSGTTLYSVKVVRNRGFSLYVGFKSFIAKCLHIQLKRCFLSKVGIPFTYLYNILQYFMDLEMPFFDTYLYFPYLSSKNRFGCPLGPPQRGGSNEYKKSDIEAKISAITYTPAKATIYFLLLTFAHIDIL